VTVVAGVDEAGYGPLLGPLVVSAAACRVDDPVGAAAGMWDRLSDVACRPGGGAGKRLAVGDSKRIFRGREGLGRLERSVLAFAAAAELPVTTVEDLAGAVLSAGCRDSLGAHRWYASRGERLPLRACGEGPAAEAGRLRRSCREGAVEVLPTRSRLLAEGEFNRRVGAVGNKASVLAGLVAELLRELRDAAGTQALDVHVDRMGGRTNYLPVLSLAWPEGFAWEEGRRPERQCYRVDGLAGPTRIEFRVRAEEHCFPAALASMFSKYLREVYMLRFNAFWREVDPDLPATSGYYADAQRFLRAVERHRRRLGIAESELVRCR
jgi:hypothetical protein